LKKQYLFESITTFNCPPPPSPRNDAYNGYYFVLSKFQVIDPSLICSFNCLLIFFCKMCSNSNKGTVYKCQIAYFSEKIVVFGTAATINVAKIWEKMWLYHYFLQQAEGLHLYFSEYQLDITSNMAVGALWKWQKIELGYENSITSPFSGERRRFDRINRKITRIVLLKRLNFFL